MEEETGVGVVDGKPVAIRLCRGRRVQLPSSVRHAAHAPLVLVCSQSSAVADEKHGLIPLGG